MNTAADEARERSLAEPLARRLRPAALLIAITIGLTMPATYSTLERSALRREATAHAEGAAARLRGLARNAPWAWRDRVGAPEHPAFTASQAGVVAVRILDADGSLVAEHPPVSRTGTWPQWARLVGAAPITLGDRRVGTVEVEMAQASLLTMTLGVFVASALSGLALAAFVYRYPVWVVRRMENRILRPVDTAPASDGAPERQAAERAEAVENKAQLYEGARAGMARMRRLAELNQRVGSSLDSTRVLDSVAEAAFDLLDVDLVRLWVLEETSAALRQVAERSRETNTSASMTVRTLTLGQGLVGLVVSEQKKLYSPNLLDEPRLVNRAWVERGGYVSALVVPLVASERPLGALAVATKTPRRFSQEEEELLDHLAANAGSAIENARVYERATRHQQRLAALLRSTHAVMAELDLGTILQRIIREAAEMASTPHVKILLVDRKAAVLRVGAWMGTPVPPDFQVPLGTSYSGTIAVTGRPLFIADTQSDPENPLRERDRQFGVLTFLGLPVKAGDEVLGVLSFNTEQPRQYSDEELAYLGSFADQAAIAIQHARLYETLERRLTRLETLTRLNRLISSSLDRDEILREINRAAAQLMEAPMASFWLADAAGQWLDAVAFSDPAAGRDYSRPRLRVGEGAVGWAAQHRRVVDIPDVFADERPVGLDWWRAHGLSSQLAVPIVFDDALLGVLALNGRTPFRLDADDESLLASFVAQIAVAIRNARLFSESETRRRAAEALAEVGHILSETRDPEVVGQHVVARLVELLGTRSAVLYQADLASGKLVVAARAGENATMAPEGRVFPLGTGVVGLAVEERRPVATANVLTDARITLLPEQRAQAERGSYRAILVVPLLVEGRLIGALGVGDREGRVFDSEDVRLAQTFGDQAALALECARLYQQAEQALADLRAKNAELDSFVYSVSHDLKTPLVAIEGMAGALREDYDERLDDQGRHYLRRLQANVAQMERLIQDLLALSRVGRESRPPEPVRLADVVDGVLLEWEHTIRERGITVIVGDLGVVLGVRTELEQVIGNLVGNAIKHLGDQPSPTIEIGAIERGEILECFVKDNGIGIDPAYHERVFEIFQRLKEIETEGTGVGLAIVKKVVESAGGRVWVESARGAGATFRFTWPTGGERTSHGMA